MNEVVEPFCFACRNRKENEDDWECLNCLTYNNGKSVYIWASCVIVSLYKCFEVTCSIKSQITNNCIDTENFNLSLRPMFADNAKSFY